MVHPRSLIPQGESVSKPETPQLIILSIACKYDVHVFLRSVDIPNCPKSSVSHLCWSHSAVSCRCMQITISNQIGNHANQYPACNYQNSVQFSDRGLSQRQVSRIIGALLGAISKVLCRFRETNSRTQGHRLKAVTDGRVRFCIVKGDLILSLSGSWPGELEAVFFRTVQRSYVQRNLSVTTTSIIRFIACDLFSNVF